ncbi:ATP-binding protein [Microbacterium esteraromaticum]|uniref:ATP-binding protein n=1 Tax=Microbacterium esteraromaticum TaxID=57043 RepID=A0A7D7WGG9_9MICO|nr:ATP-binding protein [Microbacterium esteraromaticum]QMU95830.1 ATP-binding protein [Microbacterium esteraromaticum]
MAADERSLKEAWSSIPSQGEVGIGLERFTGQRMERILSTVAAIGSAALGAQALLGAVTRLTRPDIAHVGIMVLVFAPLLWMIVACVIGKGIKPAAGTFTIAYAIALALWPVVVDRSVREPSSQPWIFFLVNIGVVAAMLAFSTRVQLAWALALPILYGWVRLVQGDFEQSWWISTGFDVSFTIILGAVIISLAWMFRQVAAGVDEARSQAVEGYASAAAASAAEEERVAMSALMHDSVLAALIAAERAGSERERTLAVAMAREALTRLANTEASIAQEGSDAPVAKTQIVAELRRTLSEQGVDAVVEERGEATAEVPGKVARAIVLAARQAIGNALAHAGGRGLHIIADSAASDRLSVTVLDAGPGFDPDAIGEDRLGIRASIIARMAAVAGKSRIDSDAEGTTVVLSWEPS